MDDLISRQMAIDALEELKTQYFDRKVIIGKTQDVINNLPSAQPERLTDDDFEAIRIHLSAYKEKLCNQNRWKEAEEYQRIIDRFMSFASAPERKRGRWIDMDDHALCSLCGAAHYGVDKNYCPNCGADMRGKEE